MTTNRPSATAVDPAGREAPSTLPAARSVDAGRRRLLGASGIAALGGASLLVPGRGRARSLGTDDAPLQTWPRAYADVPEQYGPTDVRLSRPLPRGLAGTLYRNGPARMHRGPTAYLHWFDGDGMMQAFRLSERSLRHEGRMIRTGKYVADEQAGRLLHSGFGTAIPGAQRAARPDDVNVANISVLPIGGELLALWEAGAPWRVDPESLRTLGRKVWSPETDGVAFSAHPKVDRDGTVWSFGYLPGSGRLVLYRLDAGGAMRATGMIETADAEMVHDFAITGRWLVFVLMPLTFDAAREDAGIAFIDRYQWQPQRPGAVVLVDKDTLSIAHRIEIPATPFFHVANAWDDGDSVRVQVMSVASFDGLMHAIGAAMRGQAVAPEAGGGPVEVVVSTRRDHGTVHALSRWQADFPQVDPRRVGRRTRDVFAVARGTSMPQGLFGLNTLVRLDTDSGRSRHFDYGPDVLAEEHVFVPRAGAAPGQGWLVGTALDHARGQTLLSVFDAGALDAGPLTQARLPYGLPLGLHGAFVAA